MTLSRIPHRLRRPLIGAGLSLSLLLAACGGGGGGGAPTPPPAAPDTPAVACATADVTWTVGQKTCGASVAGADSGLSALVDDATEPTVGKASFLCTNGAWAEQAAPAAECVEVAPPVVPPCPAETLEWAADTSRCSAAAPQTAAGSTLQLNDVVAPTTGAATFSCAGGNWQLQAGSTCVTNEPPPPPPVTCPASLQSWTVGGNTCDAGAPQTNAGSALVLLDNVEPTTGDALFACVNGNWTQQNAASATCNLTQEPPPPPPPPPPLQECEASALDWTVAGQTCQANAPRSSSGSSLSLTDSVAPATGTALFSCSDGTWSQRATPPATCVLDTPPPPPPVECTPATLNWGAAPDVCSAVSPQTTSGSTVQLFDDLEPTQGTAAFACNNGAWSLQAFPTPQCVVDAPSPPPPPQEACGPKDLTWSVAGRVCNAGAAGSQSGTFVTLVDKVAPTVGEALFVCVNGEWWQQPLASTSCAVVPSPPLPPPEESLQ